MACLASLMRQVLGVMAGMTKETPQCGHRSSSLLKISSCFLNTCRQLLHAIETVFSSLGNSPSASA